MSAVCKILRLTGLVKAFRDNCHWLEVRSQAASRKVESLIDQIGIDSMKHRNRHWKKSFRLFTSHLKRTSLYLFSNTSFQNEWERPRSWNSSRSPDHNTGSDHRINFQQLRSHGES